VAVLFRIVQIANCRWTIGKTYSAVGIHTTTTSSSSVRIHFFQTEQLHVQSRSFTLEGTTVGYDFSSFPHPSPGWGGTPGVGERAPFGGREAPPRGPPPYLHAHTIFLHSTIHTYMRQDIMDNSSSSSSSILHNDTLLAAAANLSSVLPSIVCQSQLQSQQQQAPISLTELLWICATVVGTAIGIVLIRTLRKCLRWAGIITSTSVVVAHNTAAAAVDAAAGNDSITTTTAAITDLMSSVDGGVMLYINEMVQDTGKFKLNNSFQNNVHYIQAKIACDMKVRDFIQNTFSFHTTCMHKTWLVRRQ